MKTMWCWRCQTEAVMLEEPEASVVEAAFRRSVDAAKTARSSRRDRPDRRALDVHFQPVLHAYEPITGVRATDHVALRHHFVAI